MSDDDRQHYRGDESEHEHGHEHVHERQGMEEKEGQPDRRDGALRGLPVRRLPLADGESNRAENAPRAWHWVPMGALVTLVTTTLGGLAVMAAVPETEEVLRSFFDAVAGVQDQTEAGAVVEAFMEGPHGEAMRRVVIAMTIAFCAATVLAGFIATSLGRAGLLEASLGPPVFVVLSLLFYGGGGTAVMAIPSAAVATGLAAAGGWIGSRLRPRRTSAPT